MTDAEMRGQDMQDAPERIWAWSWQTVPMGQWGVTQSPSSVSYTRTDLCITDAECQRRIDAAVQAEREACAAKIRSATDSRNHFNYSAKSQRDRCARLRHRQRALLSGLEEIRRATSLDDAKVKANIAIGGWSDDELIYNAIRARGQK